MLVIFLLGSLTKGNRFFPNYTRCASYYNHCYPTSFPGFSFLFRERTLVVVGHMTTWEGLMYFFFSLVHGSEQLNIDKTRGNAHAICFRKVNKGARFVCDCSVETMFYEDHFENCEFDKFNFQAVLCCVNKKVLT